jgi:hypothetical protein
MPGRYGDLPVVEVPVDASETIGPLASWRHSFSQGAISSLPLSDRAVEAIRRLEPRILRMSPRQFLFVRRLAHGFDRSRMDRCVDSASRTGTGIAAAPTARPSDEEKRR